MMPIEMSMRPTALLLLLVLPLAAGCVSEPRANEKGVRISAQRLLALDFGSKTTGRRLDRLESLPAAFAKDLQRPVAWRQSGQTVRDELRRVSTLPDKLRAGAGYELLRAPKRLDLLLPSVQEFEQSVADGLDQGLRLLGTSLHPLGEISDREPRTDHEAERPELTLLQRLRRRLRL